MRLLSKKGYKPRQLFNYKKTELLSLELSNLSVDTTVLTNPEFLWKFIKDSVIRLSELEIFPSLNSKPIQNKIPGGTSAEKTKNTSSRCTKLSC